MSPTEKAVTQGLSAAVITLMLVSITLIVLAFIFLLFCFYVRAKLYRTARNATPSARIRILMVHDHHPHTQLRRGLDPELLRSLPATNNSGGLECAVCLADITQGEDVRVLPACRHGFHLQCIDTWFRCNDTCPICRSLVVAQPAGEGHLVDVLSVPQAEERMLEINVPRDGDGGFMDADSPLQASRMPVPLAYERLRSLGRRLSRGRREIGGGGSVCNQLRTSSNLSA